MGDEIARRMTDEKKVSLMKLYEFYKTGDSSGHAFEQLCHKVEISENCDDMEIDLQLEYKQRRGEIFE